MAVFHNENIHARHVLQGDIVQLRVERPDTIVLDAALRAHFDSVRERLGAAVSDGAMPSAAAHDVAAALEAARTEAAAAQPSRPRLESALSTVARLTAGATAAAGLTEAVRALLSAVGAA